MLPPARRSPSRILLNRFLLALAFLSATVLVVWIGRDGYTDNADGTVTMTTRFNYPGEGIDLDETAVMPIELAQQLIGIGEAVVGPMATAALGEVDTSRAFVVPTGPPADVPPPPEAPGA
jgi:hypothetical protein